MDKVDRGAPPIQKGGHLNNSSDECSGSRGTGAVAAIAGTPSPNWGKEWRSRRTPWRKG